MTRITIGPFNRVEGDLEVKLDIEDGVVTTAEVTVPLYRGFEQILGEFTAGEALRENSRRNLSWILVVQQL